MKPIQVKETDSVFARQLKRRMSELDISQAELAKRIDRTQAYVSMYVNSIKRNPQASTILIFAKGLGTTPNYLLGFDNERSLNEGVHRTRNNH